MIQLNLLNRLALIATTRPKLSLCAVGVCFILLSTLALGIKLDVDLNNMVPKGDPRFSYVFESLQRFGGVDRAFIAIENTSDLDPETSQIPQEQTQELRDFIDHICRSQAHDTNTDASSLSSPLTLSPTQSSKQNDDGISQWVWTNPKNQQQEQVIPLIQGYHNPEAKQSQIDTIVARSYLFLDDDKLDTIIKRLNPKYLNAKLQRGPSAAVPAEFRDRDLLGIWSEYIAFWAAQHDNDRPLQMDGSYLCTKDKRFHVLMLYPQHPAKNMEFCLHISERLQQLSKRISAHNSNLIVHMMGGYITAAADFKTVRNDLAITMLSSLIGVIFLFGMVYRSLRLIVLIAVGLLPAILATLGLTTLFIGSQLSLIATIFAAILIGLGVDFIIHLYNAYCWALCNNTDDTGKIEPDRAQAARQAVARVGPSITLGCITSVGTFAVLATSNFRGLLELGVVSSIGLLVILFSLMIIVPAFLTLWGPRKARQPKGLHTYGKILVNHPRIMSGIGLALLTLAISTLALSPQLFTLDDNLRNLRPYNKNNEDTLNMAAKLGIRFGTHRITIYSQHRVAESDRDTASEDLLNETLSFIQSLDHLRSAIDFTLSEDLKPALLRQYRNTVAITLEAPLTESLARHVIMTPWGQCRIDAIDATGLHNISLLDQSQGAAADLQTIPAGTTLQLMPLLGASQLDHLTFISPQRQHHNIERLRTEVDWKALDALLITHSDKEKIYGPFFADMRELSQRIGQHTLLLPQELAQSPMRAIIDSFYHTGDDRDYIMLQLNLLHDRSLVPLDEFRAAMGISLDSDGMPAQIHGFTVGTFGIPTISNYMQKTIVGDFVSLTSIAMALVLIILFIGVRQPLHVLLAIVTLGAGLLASLAIMRACNTPWNVLNIAVVPLIIGIGIDNSVHFLHCLKHHSFDKQGVMDTIAETGHPIMMTALTSIIGFASLLLNSYRGIHGIGTLAAIGIFACMVAALLGLPLLILGINKFISKD